MAFTRADTYAHSYSSFSYNDWYDNSTDDAGGYLTASDVYGPGTQYEDPLFTDWSADGDCTNDDLALQSSSL